MGIDGHGREASVGGDDGGGRQSALFRPYVNLTVASVAAAVDGEAIYAAHGRPHGVDQRLAASSHDTTQWSL